MRMVELVGDSARPIVPIEIKGGTDKSNVYNRGGEAEKSHRGAKSRGYAKRWTIIHMANVDIEKLRHSSPMPTDWFDANEVISQSGNGWTTFQDALTRSIGLA